MSSRPRILCVDDEPHVLEALRDRLHRSFDVAVASSGVAGLELLRAEPDSFAIVISDMRMPGMPGDAFLREARMAAPHAVRMLLTGHADTEAAVRAVNHAQLFRFLTKPCDADELLRACAAALGHHRLLTAERALLEQTLKGSVDALATTLALASPAAFGRGRRIMNHAAQLAASVAAAHRWELEVAAQLATIGAVTLPAATAEKWYAGHSLTIEEQAMVARVPEVTRSLLGKIPRLDGVVAILDASRTTPTPGDPLSIGAVPEPARILRIAVDFDELESAGGDAAAAISTMRARRIYDPYLLAKLSDALGVAAGRAGNARDVMLAELELGMMLGDDVRAPGGGLLVARGHVVDEHMIERLTNLSSDSVLQPLRVIDAVRTG